MSHARRWQVVFLPGGIMPASPAYGSLLEELGDAVEPRVKDLEVYASDAPPPGYSLRTEVDGISRTADDAGFDRFHLVGYSAGGASCLAFAATYPERLLSLALMEPAFAGWQRMTPEERAMLESFRPVMALPDREAMAEFRSLQLAPGVVPPPSPPGPPPEWMRTRPGGMRAFLDAFLSSDLQLETFRSFDRPVYFAVGGRSNPDYYARMAVRLSTVFPDFTVEVFPERHHFDPPHRIEPARVAESLRALWRRAEPLDS